MFIHKSIKLMFLIMAQFILMSHNVAMHHHHTSVTFQQHHHEDAGIGFLVASTTEDAHSLFSEVFHLGTHDFFNVPNQLTKKLQTKYKDQGIFLYALQEEITCFIFSVSFAKYYFDTILIDKSQFFNSKQLRGPPLTSFLIVQ